jgi:Holliday junction resolvase RusA-like endonuclease
MRVSPGPTWLAQRLVQRKEGNRMTQTTKPALKLFVPGKPVSVNAAYRHTGRRVYMTYAAFEWKQAVYYAVLEEVTIAKRRTSFKPPIAVRYLIQGVKGDADNYLKLCQDGVAAALLLNDKHFQVASAKVEPNTLPRGCWLEIQEVTE